MKQAIRKLIYLKLCTISSENKPPKEETPEEVIPWSEISWREKWYLKFQDLDILYRRNNRNKFVVDNIFALNGEFEPQTVEKYRRRIIDQYGIHM